MKRTGIYRGNSRLRREANRLGLAGSTIALVAIGMLASPPAKLCAQSAADPQTDTPVRVTDKLTPNIFDDNSASARAAHESSTGVLATETFTYKGVSQSVTAPKGAYEMRFRVVGGHGGNTIGESDKVVFRGGDGAEITGRIAVNPGDTFTIFVGQTGGDGDTFRNPGSGGAGFTGNGGRGGGGQVRDGAGGGGASGIAKYGDNVVIAGGGGGAGGMGFIGPADDPGGGGSSGRTADNGVNGKGPGAGKGGQGGGNGAGPGGSGTNGSNTGGGGGGAGAGLAGGKGGSGGGFGGGGGGGGGAGSSFLAPIVQGSTIARGTTSDGNGLIVISWNDGTVPECSDQTIVVPRNSPGVRVQLTCSFASSFQLLSLPDHGFLDNRDLIRGTLTYVPLGGYTGLDSFLFVGVDTYTSAPAVVTFDVR